MKSILPEHIPALRLSLLRFSLNETIGLFTGKRTKHGGRGCVSRACFWVKRDGEDTVFRFTASDNCPLRASSRALHQALGYFYSLPSDIQISGFTTVEKKSGTFVVKVFFSDGQRNWHSKAEWNAHQSFNACYLRAVMNGFIYWLRMNQRIGQTVHCPN